MASARDLKYLDCWYMNIAIARDEATVESHVLHREVLEALLKEIAEDHEEHVDGTNLKPSIESALNWARVWLKERQSESPTNSTLFRRSMPRQWQSTALAKGR
jgi:hypothetical protein